MNKLNLAYRWSLKLLVVCALKSITTQLQSKSKACMKTNHKGNKMGEMADDLIHQRIMEWIKAEDYNAGNFFFTSPKRLKKKLFGLLGMEES